MSTSFQTGMAARPRGSIPTTVIGIDDLRQLRTAAPDPCVPAGAPSWSVPLSCNEWRHAWIVTRWGWIPEWKRIYVHDVVPVVQEWVELMLERPDSWRGGRFYVTLDEVLRTSDRTLLAYVSLAA